MLPEGLWWNCHSIFKNLLTHGSLVPKVEESSLNLDLPIKLIHCKNRFYFCFAIYPARPLLAAFWDLYSALLWPLPFALPSIILSVSALSSFSGINHPITSSPNSEILRPEKEVASP